MKINLVIWFVIVACLQSNAQKINNAVLFDSLFAFKNLEHFWKIKDYSPKGYHVDPPIFRIIDIDGNVFDSTEKTTKLNYIGYVLSKPKPYYLLDMNTGKFREIIVGSKINHIDENRYVLTLILYPYGCTSDAVLSKYSMDILLNKNKDTFDIVSIKCCGDVD